MTSQEFVLWLKGFTDALPPDEPTTLKQWTTLKDKLAEVSDEQPNFAIGGMGVPNTQPFPRWQEPHLVNVPYHAPSGTIPATGFIVTTTPGSSIGTITTPNGMSTGTTYGYPSGSAWSFTSHIRN